MHSFEVHSNESACRKSGCLGLEQVMYQDTRKIYISRQPVCLSNYDYDYIVEEIGRRDKIEFERDLEVYSADKEN